MIRPIINDAKLLTVVIVFMTGLDYFIASILINYPEISFFVVLLLFMGLIIFLLFILAIWGVMPFRKKEMDGQEKILYTFILTITIAEVLIAFLIYSIETILSSGIISSSAVKLSLETNKNGLAIIYETVLFIFQLKFIYNFIGCLCLLLIGFIWVKQFKKWYNFAKTTFIKSLYYSGFIFIFLFVIQFLTFVLQYYLYWTYPGQTIKNYSPLIQSVIITFLLLAIILYPIYIYFLSTAGYHLYKTNDKKYLKSKLRILIPLLFYFIWVILNISSLSGDNLIGDIALSLLFNILNISIFIPIAIGFYKNIPLTNSKFLKTNLFTSCFSTIGLSFFGLVSINQWSGLEVIPGYITCFLILIWSLGNISEYVGSRDALSNRLKDAGNSFLSDISKAVIKDQSYKQMVNVLLAVSDRFMTELKKMDVVLPPSEEEIMNYIVSTVGGTPNNPSEKDLREYIELVSKTANKIAE